MQGHSGESSPASISRCITAQHIVLPAAARSGRLLRLSAAAASIPSTYNACLIRHSVTLIPAPLVSRCDSSPAGKAAPLEVPVTDSCPAADLRLSTRNCIRFWTVYPIYQDYLEILPW